MSKEGEQDRRINQETYDLLLNKIKEKFQAKFNEEVVGEQYKPEDKNEPSASLTKFAEEAAERSISKTNESYVNQSLDDIAEVICGSVDRNNLNEQDMEEQISKAVSAVEENFYEYSTPEELREKREHREEEEEYELEQEDFVKKHKKAIQTKPLHKLQDSPVMVFAQDQGVSLVLDTMNKYATDNKWEKKNIHDVLADANKPLETKSAASLNKAVIGSIEKARASKPPKLHNVPPAPGKDDKTTTYTHEGKTLTQHEKDGKFSFDARADNFTGIVTVQREDGHGNLLKDQVDVVEYKNGEPIAVSMATKGTCRIANIDGLQRRAMRGVAVSAKALGKTKEGRVDVIAAPPPTPGQERKRGGHEI